MLGIEYQSLTSRSSYLSGDESVAIMVRMRILMESRFSVSRRRQKAGVALCLVLFLTIECPLLLAQEQPDRAWAVHFEGNESYSTSVLRNVIATTPPTFFKKLFGRPGNAQLREVELRRDVIRIERYYQRRGFDEVSVDWRLEPMGRNWKKRVVFEIGEGVPQRVGTLEVVFQGSEDSETRIRESRGF
ncbi:MAG: POTRA domain-containing protein, partial [Balneolaceae bacterium]